MIRDGNQLLAFIDAIGPLTRDELAELLLRLSRDYDDEVPHGATLRDEKRSLVMQADRNGWLSQLIREAIAAYPLQPQLQEFVARYPGWKSATVLGTEQPTEALVVLGGQVFIGRNEFRRYLKSMPAATGKKVLVVSSERRRAGKSYSKELLYYLSESTNEGCVAVHLSGDLAVPLSLVGAVGRQMGLAVGSIPSSGGQQAARWSQDLAAWLVDGARSTNQNWWVVFDGFTGVLSEELHDFIGQLCVRVKSQTRLRLVLLDYAYHLPPQVRIASYRETVVPISEQDLRDYFSRLHANRKGVPPHDEALSEYLASVEQESRRLLAEDEDLAEDPQFVVNAAVATVVEQFLPG